MSYLYNLDATGQRIRLINDSYHLFIIAKKRTDPHPLDLIFCLAGTRNDISIGRKLILNHTIGAGPTIFDQNLLTPTIALSLFVDARIAKAAALTAADIKSPFSPGYNDLIELIDTYLAFLAPMQNAIQHKLATGKAATVATGDIQALGTEVAKAIERLAHYTQNA